MLSAVSKPAIPPMPQIPPPPVPSASRAPNPSSPSISETPASEAPSSETPPESTSLMNYGVDDVLGESRVSEPSSVTSGEYEKPQEVEDEVCYTLPFRQGGFFRPWLNAFFVINKERITMYPNEKRNERKSKDILLYDASAGVGVVVESEG